VTAAKRVYLGVGVASALILLALWLQPRVEEALAPEPRRAWVAVEVVGSGEAVVGPIEVAAGTDFRVHAVLEAEGRDGELLYYSEAPALRFGERRVEEDRLRRWRRSEGAKVLWFTIEARSPYRSIESSADLEALAFEEFFHPEWSTLWQIEGSLSSRLAEQLASGELHHREFGTQRFQAWIELIDPDMPLVPTARFRSLGAADLPARVGEIAGVSATLEGPIGPASAVFGLVGLGLLPDADPEILRRVARLSEQRLAFTPLTVLREMLREAGVAMGELEWSLVELNGAKAWHQEAHPGDLVRVGSRFVVLLRDGNGDGRLDGMDLCLDFDEGAAVRRLGEVFPGEGEIEWTTLIR
jgi:hypothetical protein